MEQTGNTPEAITAHLAQLRAKGVTIFDMRDTDAAQKDIMLTQIRDEIRRQHIAAGLSENCETTFVAGSGQTDAPDALAQATEVGGRCRSIVTGGSMNSVMGAAAKAATVKIAVTCRPIINSELPDERYNIVVIADTDGFEERLRVMRQLTSHEIAVHGGMGTTEEILGGIKERECLQLLVPFWAPLARTMSTMFGYGYISERDMRCVNPVDEHGNESGTIDCATNPDATSFRTIAAAITSTANQRMKERNCRVATLGGDAHVDDLIECNDAFILPPGGIEAMLQATQIICWKRMDIRDPVSARYSGLDNKPIIVLNVDHCYDGFIQQWRDMQAGGFLAPGESVERLLKVVDLPRDARPSDIRSALNAIVPTQKQPRGDISLA